MYTQPQLDAGSDLLGKEIFGNKMRLQYRAEARAGDHIWWINDVSRFRLHYPEWTLTRSLRKIPLGIYEAQRGRSHAGG